MIDFTDNLAFLAETLGLPSPTFDPVPAPAMPAARVIPSEPAERWNTGFPALDQVGRISIQYFDNGVRAKKGAIQYVLTVQVWSKSDPDAKAWTTYVDLIDPTKVVAWAVTQSDINPEIKPAEYGRVRDNLTRWRDQETSADLWIRMGHIKTSPGKQYYPNEFVTARFVDETLAVTLHIRGQQIEFDRTYPNKSSNPKSAKLHAWRVFE